MENKYDILLVGSGLHNAVFARLATDAGYKCLVIEKRKEIGGNVHDFNWDGINVHKYGAHIFHTSDEDVWRFVNKYTSFNNYINSPIANYKSEIYNLPFNMNTFHQMWNDVITPKQAQRKINEQVNKNIIPTNLEEKAISMVGNDIYTKLIKGYTEKQWGVSCKELSPDIITRLPVRYTYNNNYFNDKYQGIPVDGYTNLIEKLFEGCDVKLGVDYFDVRNYFKHIIPVTVYSGCIDQYFDYIYGKLQYRSLKFEFDTFNIQNYQGNAVVNYTDRKTPYTRIIEHKHFDVWNRDVLEKDFTVITREYPVIYEDNIEPYYPINNGENMKLYNRYFELTKGENNVIFGGRLSEYKYYDMDKVIKSAMNHFDTFIKSKGVK